MQFLEFILNAQRFGIRAESVKELVRAVAITPLPGAPAVVEGIIDVRGAIAPVFDMRRRFGLPVRAVELDDHFILVGAGSRLAALHVDRVLDLVAVDERQVADHQRRVDAPHIEGVATLPDGLMLIHDVERFLSRAESESLDAALAGRERSTTGT